jgi:hypothetical protein
MEPSRAGVKVIRYGHPIVPITSSWDYMHLENHEMSLLCDKLSFMHRDPSPAHDKVGGLVQQYLGPLWHSLSTMDASRGRLGCAAS